MSPVDTAPTLTPEQEARRADRTAEALRHVAALIVREMLHEASTAGDGSWLHNVLGDAVHALYAHVRWGDDPFRITRGFGPLNIECPEWQALRDHYAARLRELLASSWGEPGAEDADAPEPAALVHAPSEPPNPLHVAVEEHALAPIADDGAIVPRAVEVMSAAIAVGHPGGAIGGAS